MTIAISLADVAAGTALVAVHHGLSVGVSPADEIGWRESLDRLARLVE